MVLHEDTVQVMRNVFIKIIYVLLKKQEFNLNQTRRDFNLNINRKDLNLFSVQ